MIELAHLQLLSAPISPLLRVRNQGVADRPLVSEKSLMDVVIFAKGVGELSEDLEGVPVESHYDGHQEEMAEQVVWVVLVALQSTIRHEVPAVEHIEGHKPEEEIKPKARSGSNHKHRVHHGVHLLALLLCWVDQEVEEGQHYQELEFLSYVWEEGSILEAIDLCKSDLLQEKINSEKESPKDGECLHGEQAFKPEHLPYFCLLFCWCRYILIYFNSC